MRDNEVIVKLLGEGGSKALYGVREQGRWLYSRQIIDTSPSGDDQPEIVESFSDALRLLGRVWAKLRPGYVHPAFRDSFLAAAADLLGREDPTQLAHWRKACTPAASTEEPRITQQLVHASDSWLYAEVDDLEPSETEVEKLRARLRSLGASAEVAERMVPGREK